MPNVNSATGSGNVAADALSLARSQSNDLMGDTQERFLTLLVTQLQNQDPLNPMDNAQVTSQIAQLSTVSGINQLNDTLLAVAGQMDVSQSMQAANLIGKDVFVPGNKIAVGRTGEGEDEQLVGTPFGVELSSPASKLEVKILDGSGKVIRNMSFDAVEAGVHQLPWDGRGDDGLLVPDGAYRMEVKGLNTEGREVHAEALTYGHVRSVAYSPKGLELDLGLAGKHSLLDIRQIM